MIASKKNKVTLKQKKRVEEEFFTRSFVQVDWDIQGQLTYNKKKAAQHEVECGIFIGPWAGPEASLSNLVHEMSHFVEIDEERMDKPAWGLTRPEIWVVDRYCCEPRTTQMTMRELRVLAFQANVLEYLGSPVSITKLVSPTTFMADFYLLPKEDGSTAWGDARDKSLGYQETQKSQLRWCANKVTELRKTHTLELFLSEWKRRNEILLQRDTR